MEWVISSKVAVYLLCAFMGLVAIIIRRRCGSWSNPSVVFALFWCIMTTLPIVFVPEIEPSAGAIGYITAAVTAFAVPVFFISWHEPLDATKARQNSVGSIFFSGNEAIVLLSMMQAATLCCMIANVAYQGFPVAGFFLDPFSLGCKYLDYRYSGSVKPFALAQVGTVLNYVAAPLAGLVVAHRKSYMVSTGAVLLCLIPSFYNVAVYADKGTIFLTLAFFYGAVIVGRIRHGYTNLLTVRSIVSGLLLLLMVASVIGMAMINRTTKLCEQNQTVRVVGLLISSLNHKSPDADKPQSLNDDKTKMLKLENAESTRSGGGLKYYLRSYAFGHLFAFSSWYDNWLNTKVNLQINPMAGSVENKQHKTLDKVQSYNDPTGPTYGFWTFMAIGEYFAPTYFRTVPDGYFGEYYEKDNIIKTNIYTFFRGLIYDFTITGSLAAIAFSGLVFNFSYRQLMFNAYEPISKVVYIFFLGYLYTSVFISLLIWGSVYLCCIGILLIFISVQYIDRNGGSAVDLIRRYRAKIDFEEVIK